jgi:hypothetical protein
MAVEAICKLKSLSPLSFSRHYTTPAKADKEKPDAYEERTWRERLHYDDKGVIFIPPMAFKLSIAEAAAFLSLKIPGKRNATYTKHFEAGILVLSGVSLGLKKDDIPGERLFVPSDGKRGGGSRVMKIFPLVQSWSGTVTYHILDATITHDVFEQVLGECGNFIGIGRFRPRNNGYYGRFAVTGIEWVVAD